MNDTAIQSDTSDLTDEEIEDMRRMLQWWKFSRDEKGGIQRPKFKRGSETQVITIRLGTEMVQAAKQYAKQHRDISGGTLSGLIEFLIWHTLSCDPKFTDAE